MNHVQIIRWFERGTFIWNISYYLKPPLDLNDMSILSQYIPISTNKMSDFPWFSSVLVGSFPIAILKCQEIPRNPTSEHMWTMWHHTIHTSSNRDIQGYPGITSAHLSPRHGLRLRHRLRWILWPHALGFRRRPRWPRRSCQGERQAAYDSYRLCIDSNVNEMKVMSHDMSWLICQIARLSTDHNRS